MPSSIERITVTLPDGFVASKHQQALLKAITDRHGEGFELDSIDPAGGTATASRQASITEVHAGQSADSFEVRLARGTKPADGDKVATKLADQHDGFEMTWFEPFLGKATMSRLTADVTRCRSAVAVALGVKPWEVQVSPTAEGGFALELPGSYMPSKHDEKLDEVATQVVGRPGWYVEADAGALTAHIVPSEPPTFAPQIAYPTSDRPPEFDPAQDGWARIPLGLRLASKGQDSGEVLYSSFVSNPAMQVSGLAGSGKGVFLTNLITGALARGWQFGLVDAVKSGVDYTDFQPFVHPGLWAENPTEAVCVLNMAYAEGIRRKKLIKSHGVQKFTQLPAELDIRPLLVVVDEATSLLLTEKVPTGIPKDNPLALEIAERNLLKATALDVMSKIPRELRFAGVSLCMASQVASTTVGIPTELRTNLGAKVLLGASPTENNRKLALQNPSTVPEVPSNVAADPNGASRGSGVFEFEGTEPGVFKSYFTPPATLAAWLDERNVPTTTTPAPTPEQVARHTPASTTPAVQTTKLRVSGRRPGGPPTSFVPRWATTGTSTPKPANG